MSRFSGTKGHWAVWYGLQLPDHSEVWSFAGAYRDKLSIWEWNMQHRNALSEPKRLRFEAWAKAGAETDPHPADRHVGRQVATVRVQSDVSQAQLARSVGISFQQLQKYENARNRVSASMLYEIGKSLGVPVSRFFEGLPGNDQTSVEARPLPVDERLDFIASGEGRRLIEGLMNLPPRVRGRVSALIAALGEELALSDTNSQTADEP